MISDLNVLILTSIYTPKNSDITQSALHSFLNVSPLPMPPPSRSASCWKWASPFSQKQLCRQMHGRGNCFSFRLGKLPFSGNSIWCIRRLSIWQRKAGCFWNLRRGFISYNCPALSTPIKVLSKFPTPLPPPTIHTMSASHAIPSSLPLMPPRLLSCPGGSHGS